MVEIEEGKELRIENVLSLRKKMTVAQIEKEVYLMGQFIKSKNAVKSGYLTTCTHRVINIKKMQLLDTEIIIPLDKKDIVGNNEFAFCDVFKLENCIYTRFTGASSKIKQVILSMECYLNKKGSKQITPAYIVQIKDLTEVIRETDMVFDFYIGYTDNK